MRTGFMHIPDGFLSTPVWAALDATSVVGVAWLSRGASRTLEESRIPLLGVMGAFVFAAQMINFPVGVGTSGHLLGCGLLTFTLGPAAAAVVMTAILAIQALVFQDGGLLALGANVFNMAIAGVAAAWLPWRYLGAGRFRRLAVFAGAALPVLVAAALVLAQLRLSGVPLPGPILGVSLVLFLASALVEGAITVAVVTALEKMHPRWVQAPRHGSALPALAVTALVLAGVVAIFASPLPDGLEKLAEQVGIADRAQSLLNAPLPDYEFHGVDSDWLRRSAPGLAGVVLTACVAFLLGRILVRQRQGGA
ncbi:MAG: energy-coupling factor ABC transporter permease [Bryobacteraceae bacterium]|nr:energy-coupling factor ABC transporter permease [Bryobacteraceae bacterium]